MRRRSRRGTDASPSLFPFLAVLICTVGALIVLLVVVVQQARVHANAVVADLAPDPELAVRVEQLQQQRQSLLRQLQRLARSQAASREQLDAQRVALNQVIEDSRQLKQTLTQMDQTDQQLQQQDGETRQSVAELEKALAELNRQIDQAKERLRRATDGDSATRPAYAVIPYDGPNETRRRPIYIECLRDRVVLKPEGITFFTEDFQDNLGPNNPLAAALRATRAYLTRVQGMSPNEQAYPLLIVRPDGAEAYAAARAAMRSWDAEFGYELVTADMKLAYPPVDPALTQMLQGVVQLARQRQQRSRLLSEAVAARVSRRGSSTGFRASGQGGFVPVERDPDVDGWGSGGLTGSPSGAGPADPSTRSGSPWTSRANQGRGAGTAAFGNGTGAGRSPLASSGAGTGGATGPARNSPWPSTVEGGSGGPLSVADTAGGLAGRNVPGGQSAGGGAGQTASAAATSRRDSTNLGNGQQTDPGPSLPGTPGTSAAAGQETAGAATGGANGTAGGGASGSAAGSSGGMASMQASLAGGAPPRSAAVTPLARSRGRGWALPNSTAGAIGITRPVVVDCQRNGIVLRPEPRTAATSLAIPFQSSTRSAVQPLVDAIWDRVDSWGIAGPNVYWKPELHVSVRPGAEARFAQLRTLMQQSGIAVVRKRR